MIFGPCQETSYITTTLNLDSPREESFLIQLKYIDVSSTTRTNLDVKQEKRIDDYWNIDGSEIFLIIGQISLSLLYWKRNLQTDICGPGRD